MKCTRLAGLTASLFLCACTSTYSGRVIGRDGSPVGGAKVQAQGSWSLLSTTPWDFSAGTHVRGVTNSLSDGTFLLHASAFRVTKLTAESQGVQGALEKPSPGKTSTIMIGSDSNGASVAAPN